MPTRGDLTLLSQPVEAGGFTRAAIRTAIPQVAAESAPRRAARRLAGRLAEPTIAGFRIASSRRTRQVVVTPGTAAVTSPAPAGRLPGTMRASRLCFG